MSQLTVVNKSICYADVAMAYKLTQRGENKQQDRLHVLGMHLLFNMLRFNETSKHSVKV